MPVLKSPVFIGQMYRVFESACVAANLLYMSLRSQNDKNCFTRTILAMFWEKHFDEFCKLLRDRGSIIDLEKAEKSTSTSRSILLDRQRIQRRYVPRKLSAEENAPDTEWFVNNLDRN